MTNEGVVDSSFRDPSGFVFKRDGLILRQVNQIYAENYEALMSSGLYEKLVSKALLTAHDEVAVEPEAPENHFLTLRPEQLDFVSYPYEWCFSQLKDAALTTLRIQRIALGCNMSLKDASAYNIQFQRGRPVFIDSLSFERYRDGEPWIGYRQFCQHFLAPLALMSRVDLRLQQLLRVHIDGVPLDLAATLIGRTWFNIGLTMHLKLHAKAQQRFDSIGAESPGDSKRISTKTKLSKDRLTNLIRDLENVVRKLDWNPAGTEWAEYYSGDSYEDASLAHKKALVAKFLAELSPAMVWDLGANTGVYSRIASAAASRVVSFDVDPACVERNYREVREKGEEDILPLVLDLVNPSPAVGFANRERESVADRANADVILALALIHHIAISNNVPLERISAYFAELAPSLVIEWVPKSDAKVRTLLATREDIFPQYTRSGFEAAFAKHWATDHAVDIEDSKRTLYVLRRR